VQLRVWCKLWHLKRVGQALGKQCSPPHLCKAEPRLGSAAGGWGRPVFQHAKLVALVGSAGARNCCAACCYGVEVMRSGLSSGLLRCVVVAGLPYSYGALIVCAIVSLWDGRRAFRAHQYRGAACGAARLEARPLCGAGAPLRDFTDDHEQRAPARRPPRVA